jgi:hypothetical protein
MLKVSSSSISISSDGNGAAVDYKTMCNESRLYDSNINNTPITLTNNEIEK